MAENSDKAAKSPHKITENSIKTSECADESKENLGEMTGGAGRIECSSEATESTVRIEESSSEVVESAVGMEGYSNDMMENVDKAGANSSERMKWTVRTEENSGETTISANTTSECFGEMQEISGKTEENPDGMTESPGKITKGSVALAGIFNRILESIDGRVESFAIEIFSPKGIARNVERMIQVSTTIEPKLKEILLSFAEEMIVFVLREFNAVWSPPARPASKTCESPFRLIIGSAVHYIMQQRGPRCLKILRQYNIFLNEGILISAILSSADNVFKGQAVFHEFLIFCSCLMDIAVTAHSESRLDVIDRLPAVLVTVYVEKMVPHFSIAGGFPALCRVAEMYVATKGRPSLLRTMKLQQKLN